MFLVAPTGETYKATRRERPDLAQAFPDVEAAAAGGYHAHLPASAFVSDRGYEFTLVARQDQRAVFNCRVVSSGSSPSALLDPHWTGEALHL